MREPEGNRKRLYHGRAEASSRKAELRGPTGAKYMAYVLRYRDGTQRELNQHEYLALFPEPLEATTTDLVDLTEPCR